MNWSIPWTQILLAAYVLMVVLTVLRVLYKQHNTGTAFAWLIILFVFPLFGVIAYFMIGEPRLGQARAQRNEEMNRFYGAFAEHYLSSRHVDVEHEMGRRYHGLSKVASAITGLEATRGNRMQLFSTTDSIVEAMMDDIEAAEHSCLLMFYIIEPQGRIAHLLEAVAEAAQRGVHCTILADAVGSKNFFTGPWPDRLHEAGVNVQVALPVGPLRTLFTRVDLRNHRKLLVVDGRIGYTGSFNLADPQYFKKGAGVGEWVDVMMRCQGPAVLEMAAVFFADVAVENDENLHEVQRYLTARYQHMLPDLLPAEPPQGGIIAQVIPSAPEQSEQVIHDTILCALHAAKTRITITTPYFVPDEPLLIALTTAARRGVEVTLIMPAKVDSLLVRYASRAYYPILLEAGVRLALFEGGLLHAKTITIDGDYTLFGTVNMDMRSFFLNMEISLAIYDAGITAEVEALQRQYRAQSHSVNVHAWQQRSPWWGLIENTVRLMSPLL
ncbi:cardiolipin synthase [Neisseria sp. HSC-16F19]|nr:cardiolipin synthase [Neisseria sp. HSC-16F19]MCP2040107.1 cardiolipin synthase [Neisseria sp. HSC-16F19]